MDRRVFLGTVARSVLIGVALARLTVISAPAHAFEPGAHPPFGAGATGGIPIGAIPPAGFYLSSVTTYGESTFHADSRPGGPKTQSFFVEGLTGQWVPDVTPWGARYAAFIQQALVVRTVTGLPPRGDTQTASGLDNTIISPLNLAWTLPSDFWLSARFAFYPPDGQYHRKDRVNIANNFWAFEPNVGISYLRGGLDLSVHLVYDIETENTSSNAPGNVHGKYQSGDVFVADYTASYAIRKWRFGVTGWGVQQTTNDSAGGRTLRGTELSKVGLGPLIEYNASWIGVNLYYVHDVVWRGGFGGDKFFLRATIKF
jgi:hypothetical protein